MEHGAVGDRRVESAGSTGDVGCRLGQFVDELGRVSDRLTEIASRQEDGAWSDGGAAVDGEVRLLRSLAALQQVRSEIGVLEHAIRLLDTEIDPASSISQRAG